MFNLRGTEIKKCKADSNDTQRLNRLIARNADYTIHKCFLNANKFKIYVNFFKIPNKPIKQNTAYASH